MTNGWTPVDGVTSTRTDPMGTTYQIEVEVYGKPVLVRVRFRTDDIVRFSMNHTEPYAVYGVRTISDSDWRGVGVDMLPADGWDWGGDDSE